MTQRDAASAPMIALARYQANVVPAAMMRGLRSASHLGRGTRPSDSRLTSAGRFATDMIRLVVAAARRRIVGAHAGACSGDRSRPRRARSRVGGRNRERGRGPNSVGDGARTGVARGACARRRGRVAAACGEGAGVARGGDGSAGPRRVLGGRWRTADDGQVRVNSRRRGEWIAVASARSGRDPVRHDILDAHKIDAGVTKDDELLRSL